MEKDIALYIHIPFCKQKCRYCDFVSFAGKESVAQEYKNALIKEINAFSCEKTVKSIFIGGGTPSAVDSGIICDIMDSVGKKFNISKDAEISMETNPGTLTDEKLKDYKSCGINRLSLGLQSCDNALLKMLGRIHTYEDFLKSYELVRKNGFNNVNVDLMFALPNQSVETWEKTLQNIISLSPEHISAYSLIIEEGTPFFYMYERGELTPAAEDKDREMYYTARDILSENGYNRYEISNFAKEGMECKHNMIYWQGGDYKGFGLAAASLIGNTRYKNTEVAAEYLKGNYLDNECTEELTESDRMAEFMFLGLRCTEGISKKKFEKLFGKDIYTVYGEQLKKFINEKLLKENGDMIALTDRGIDISNMVFCEFL
jgi:oxygen-independent coproporphyrinogen-3 oxidase